MKLKTNDAGGVSLAHPALQPGYHKQAGAFVVAIEHVPVHMPAADVMSDDRLQDRRDRHVL